MRYYYYYYYCHYCSCCSFCFGVLESTDAEDLYLWPAVLPVRPDSLGALELTPTFSIFPGTKKFQASAARTVPPTMMGASRACTEPRPSVDGLDSVTLFFCR